VWLRLVRSVGQLGEITMLAGRMSARVPLRGSRIPAIPNQAMSVRSGCLVGFALARPEPGAAGICHNSDEFKCSHADLVVLSRRREPQRHSSITNATGTYSVPSFAYYHALNFFGRSSNITVSLP